MSVQINEDLVKERKKCTFDVQELIHFIDGGKQKTELRKYIENLVLSIDNLKDDIPEEYLSHKECYENVIRKGSVLYDIFSELSKDRKHKAHQAPSNAYRISDGIMQNVNPFLLHFALFVPAITNQATPEQQAEFLKHGFGIIGTYAQTELGHGTFLRGLETTATLDLETDEFVLNSPTLTSYKWWPGGLGHTANHCVVMAQLYIKGKCHGPHLFFVQIRDIETHEPLPGLKLGEIGAKMGFNTADNGFLGFHNFRIPRNNMLMKNSQVLKDGTYVESKNEKLTYGSMVFVRVYLLSDMAYMLARAATISVRYSAVRHQSHIKPDEPEVQILDFVIQQHKLFISIATSHAFKICGLWLWQTYSKVMEDIGKGSMDRLPELHALSCCLKTTSTRDAGWLIEQCRLACGGHGYLMSSNLPSLYTTATAAITYEGESTVLLLQTARYLIKSWKRAMEGESLPATVSFLSEYFNKRYNKWENTPKGIVDGLKLVVAGVTKMCAESIQKHVSRGQQYEEAWNSSSVQLIKASEAYSRALLCEVFWFEVDKVSSTLSNNLAVVLKQLAELYITYWALEKRGDLLVYTTISKDDLDKLQERYEELLALIRPNAVGLVDSFDIRDEILCSTLGAYDGRVYERMMDHALKSPLNAETVNQSFHKYMKPVILKHKI
ncbi:probable peroxisomal acyl-coenzyme A oxidase 1 [Danaus plexippus]|uniref:probable peroxisomal acyl-coenzyme A oxidase 1 n=1 Tax=Danaus plexippus TaxID=13037 RepID=UPI002AAF77D7|nr:probable peroxisomal acyl-coenzyme A oxidase 1 [Danaus plexippus]